MKRFIALVLILLMILPALPALAEQTLYVDYNEVQVYAQKSKSSKKLGKLSYGESVTCLNLYQDGNKGWAKIQNENGKIGYCKMYELTGTNPNDLDFTALTKDGAKMYTRPRTSAKVMARFTKDATVKVVALTNDGKWFRVKYSGHFGYISTGKIRPLHKVWYVGENTGLVNHHGTGENILSYGESLRIYGTTGKKTVAKLGGKFGYIFNYDKSDFVNADPCSAGKTLYIKADGVRMNSEAVFRTNAYTQFKLKKNTRVTFYGSVPGVKFARVKYNGKFGYVPKSCVSEERIGDEAIVIAKDDIKIYRGKLSEGAVVGTADKGDELILYQVKTNRAKVTVKGTGVTGWIDITDFK